MAQLEPALFTSQERERARRYHQPLYLAALSLLLLVLAVFGLLVGHSIDGLGWAGDAAAWAAIVRQPRSSDFRSTGRVGSDKRHMAGAVGWLVAHSGS